MKADIRFYKCVYLPACKPYVGRSHIAVYLDSSIKSVIRSITKKICEEYILNKNMRC